MDLKHYVRSVKDFPIPGVDFKDITPLVGNPEALTWCIDQMIETAVECDKIAAFDARGFIFGALLAYRLGKPLVLIRKQGKLPCKVIQESYKGEYASPTLEIHEDDIKKGDRVILVDDVIAVGGCMNAGCKLIERLGGIVAGCISVIEFTNMGAQNALSDYKVTSLVKYEK